MTVFAFRSKGERGILNEQKKTKIRTCNKQLLVTIEVQYSICVYRQNEEICKKKD